MSAEVPDAGSAVRPAICLLATAWGPKFGGINSFNFDLAAGIAASFGKDLAVLSTAISPSTDDLKLAALAGVTLIPVSSQGGTDRLLDEALTDVNKWLLARPEFKVRYWVGHDLITGFSAKALWSSAGGELALVHHMAYIEYHQRKGKTGFETDALDAKQRDLFSTAGAHVFAVGPLLRENCRRWAVSAPTMFVPGFPPIPRRPPDKRQLVGITFGRLDPETDRIKQGRLAVAAFAAADRKSRGAGSRAFEHSRFSIVGISADVYEEEKELNDLADRHSSRTFNLVALPYDVRRDETLARLLDCNISLMLSVHEGFGLTAWEAIGLGVPIILSKRSGVYQLIEEELGGKGIGCVRAVAVDGGRHSDPRGFNSKDLAVVTQAILDLGGDRERARRDADELRRQLMDKLSCTWEATAATLLTTMNFQPSPQARDAIPLDVAIERAGETATPPDAAGGVYPGSAFDHRLTWQASGLTGELFYGRATSNDFDHRGYIASSQSVRILLNDGFGFFSKYLVEFEHRAALTRGGSNLSTEICLLSPDGPHLATIARRSEKSIEEQQSDIQRSVKFLNDVFAGVALSQWGLYGLKGFLPYCLFEYDDCLIVSFYLAFSRAVELPMIILRSTSELSDTYYKLKANTDLMFERARMGQRAWFDDLRQGEAGTSASLP